MRRRFVVSAEAAHLCHWPGCPVEVPPRMWGCQPHWFRLPKRLRDEIWAAYMPGQEVTKSPTRRYVEVAREVQQWISDHYPSLL